MKTFGELKGAILTKLTESYSKQNKSEIKSLVSLIKENKDFREMYLLYEDIENKYFSDVDTAKYYVEELGKSLKGKIDKLKDTNKKLTESVGSVDYQYPSVYKCLDELMSEDTLLNIESKVKAKIDLVKHLTTKKDVNESESKVFHKNENLLYAVLVNNFNVLYDKSLSESEKDKLKTIVSMSNEDLEIKTKELKESILNRVESLLSESKEDELKSKLTSVKSEVNSLTSSKYNYYRLIELENGFNQ